MHNILRISVLIFAILLSGCYEKQSVTTNNIPGDYFFINGQYHEVIHIFQSGKYEHTYTKNGKLIFSNKGKWNIPLDGGRGIIFEPYKVGHDPIDNSGQSDEKEFISASFDIYSYKECIFIPFDPDHSYAFKKCE